MWPLFRRWLSPPLLLLLLLAGLQCASAVSHSSSPARRLLAASVLAKGKPSFQTVIKLRDILEGLDESTGPKSVEVLVHSDDSQRAVVVVSVQISDLFPEEGSSHSGPQFPAVGKKRLLAQTIPADPAAAGAAVATPVTEHSAAAGARQPPVRGLTGTLDASVLPGVTTWLEGASLADQTNFKKLTGGEGAASTSSSSSGGSSSSSGGGGGGSSSTGGGGTGALTLSDIPLGRRKLLRGFFAQGDSSSRSRSSSSSSSRKLLAGVTPTGGAGQGVGGTKPAVQPVQPVQPAGSADKPATEKVVKDAQAEQGVQPVQGASGFPDDTKQELAALGAKQLTTKTPKLKIQDLGLP